MEDETPCMWMIDVHNSISILLIYFIFSYKYKYKLFIDLL